MRRRPGEDRVGGLGAVALLAPLMLLSDPAAAVEGAAPGRSGPDRLALTLRARVEVPGTGGLYRAVEREAEWEAGRTAIIVCDMWDLHHCLNATRRGAEMAPRMDRVLREARDRGVQIIHAPSGCMAAYADHPARKRAQDTPRSEHLPADIRSWCDQIPAEERGAYPIDQTDGGEDDDPDEHARWAAKLAAMGRNPRAPWRAQTDKLTIDPDRDYISDDGAEIWSVLEARGIEHVVLLGVHANMCVLGRPFGLRQLAKNGMDVVLMRDMTDTMYNPQRAPYVSHFSGTDLIVEHVEKFVCPTITSDQVVGGAPFRFRDDRRPHAVFLIAEDEYRTERTLPAFAARNLRRDFRLSVLFGDAAGLPGLGALDEADLVVVSVRRRPLPADQMAALRRYVASGRPVLGLRTASHAFAARGQVPPAEGLAAWPEFDAEVLGGNYQGHHKEGPKVAIAPADGATAHPILAGLDPATLVGAGSLYRARPLKEAATPLLIGTIPGQPAEPVAWTHLGAAGGRVFYTSLGHPDDFRDPAFNRLLRNAAYWAVGLAVPPGPAAAAEDEPGFESLFNGKDLTGWRLGEEVLDGKSATSDGRFQVADGVLVITGATKPGEPKMEAIDTRTRFGGNFVLRLEFRAGREANSGLHLRDHEFPHQLQVRDYPRVGPYKMLSRYKEGDWNAIEVTVRAAPGGPGAVARCTCNGEVLEDALPIPADGPLGLQSETNTVEYRNIRIRRLD